MCVVVSLQFSKIFIHLATMSLQSLATGRTVLIRFLARKNTCSSSEVSRRDLGHTQPPILWATETLPREIQETMRVIRSDFRLSSFVVVMRRNIIPVAPHIFILRCLT